MVDVTYSLVITTMTGNHYVPDSLQDVQLLQFFGFSALYCISTFTFEFLSFSMGNSHMLGEVNFVKESCATLNAFITII